MVFDKMTNAEKYIIYLLSFYAIVNSISWGTGASLNATEGLVILFVLAINAGILSAMLMTLYNGLKPNDVHDMNNTKK